MPAWVAPVVAGAVSLASNLASNSSQGSMNEATRRWNEMMYNRQREDALLDWNRQNEYNAPGAQMERFKAAGLNPNLIYGQTNEAPVVRSTDVKAWNPVAPSYEGVGRGVAGAIGMYQDMAVQNEQIKNMEAQRTNIQLEALLKAAEITGKNLSNAKSAATFDTAVSTVNELLRSISSRTDIALSQEARNAALHAPNLMAAFERVANIGADTAQKRAQIENLKKTGILQGMEIDLRKLGMSWNDPLWARLVAQFSEGKPLPEVVKQLWTQLRQLGAGEGVQKAVANYLGVREVGFGPKRDGKGGFEQFKWSDLSNMFKRK